MINKERQIELFRKWILSIADIELLISFKQELQNRIDDLIF